jgi:hypothetical protein
MPRINRWSRSMPRIELDQLSREARLRLEQLERFILSKQRQARLRRIFYVLRGSAFPGVRRNRTEGGSR